MSLETPKNDEKIDWNNLEDGALKDVLEKIINKSNTGLILKSTMTQEEAAREIRNIIETRGFSEAVGISVSDPDERGHRQITGMTLSPKTGKEIHF